MEKVRAVPSSYWMSFWSLSTPTFKMYMSSKQPTIPKHAWRDLD